MRFNTGHIPILLLIVISGLASVAGNSSCLPGFMCIHGVCASQTSCQCDEGWTGPMCSQREVTLSPIESPTFGDIHHNETESDTLSTSILKTTPPGSRNTLNDQSAGGSKTTASASGRKTECFPGFRCLHGVCEIKSGNFACRCDAGWKGPFCHIPIGSDDGHTIGGGVLDSRMSPVDGHGPLADYSLRFCVHGFECKYGNCTCQNCSLTDPYGCKCEKNWVGTFCHILCPKNCGPHGHCAANKNGSKLWCECDPFYSGNNCSEFRKFDDQGETESYLYVICVTVSIVAVLIFVLTLVPYLLWRRGNISMLKLVFWFQTVEEDDGRMYDAFVSYASTEADRQFVMDCLIPILENQMSFTLCIHERDFMPGKYITCNIMESVRQSRRTLLVISPAFVSRNWCQFEFQTAVAEMIEKKHRILPVMIGDLQQIKKDANMNETFQRMINTVTYLQYPGEDASEQDLQKFWKRLELSMPKKTAPSSPSSPCSPVQTPTSATPLSSQHPHKTNGIIFPTSSHKISKFDEINIETLPSFNPTNTSGENHKHSPTISNRRGFISWFRKKIGHQRKSAEISGVRTQTHFPNNTLDDVSSNNQLHIKDSMEFRQHCVNNKDDCADPERLNKEKRGLKPLQIELSGWIWPTSEAGQETC